MTAKQFSIFRLMLAAILAGVVSMSVVINNYLVPIIAVVTALVLMIFMKKKVKEVMEDERDYQIAGKAARYAMTIFSAMAGLMTILFFALRQTNQSFELVGSVLAYSVCALLIFYSLIFNYLSRDSGGKRRFWYMLLIFIVVLIILVFGLRLFSGEDNWICQDGQWIKHGQPSAPSPTIPCPNN